MNDILAEMEREVDCLVRAGFDEREAIIQQTVDYLSGIEYDSDWLLTQVTERVDQRLQQHYAEQKQWTHETDCDRLDDAFAELDRNGIVARQHFACCQTCGHEAMQQEMAVAQRYRPVRGYVFFHRQDTESAVRSGHLYLAYCSVSYKPDEAVPVAQEVVDTLRRAGLEVDWNGSVQTRICIKNITWQRRRWPEES